MKIEQFRQELTTEQLNDRLSKVFGSSIDLDKFSIEQLQTAQSNVAGKIANIEQSEPFDGLSHNEEYHKQKMFLDVLDSALKDRKLAIEGYYKKVDLAADEMLVDYVDPEKEAVACAPGRSVRHEADLGGLGLHWLVSLGLFSRSTEALWEGQRREREAADRAPAAAA